MLILKYKKFPLLAPIFVFLTLLVQPLWAAVPDGIAVTLSMSKQSYAASDELAVTVHYTNITSEPITMLKFGTALEEFISEDILNVAQNGSSLAYSGPRVRRKGPTASDYVTIGPGQTVSGTVSLTQGYPVFDQGNYTVSSKEGPASGVVGASGAASVGFVLTETRPKSVAFQPPNFSACSAQQQTDINTATGITEEKLRIASSDLNNAPVGQRPTAARYVRWFGTYTAARYNKIASDMMKNYLAFRDQTITYTCDCPGVPPGMVDDFFGFVFPDQHYTINLCGAFFQQPQTGIDPMAVTLVHEMSHFTIVANTGGSFPEVYEFNNALALAQSNPDHAVDNAENHGYFANNVPAFPMPAGTTPPPPGGSSSSFISYILLLLLGPENGN